MSNSWRAFTVAGLIAVLVTAVTVPLGLAGRVPLAGDVLRRDDAAGTVGAMILTVALWVIFFAVARFRQGSAERRGIRHRTRPSERWSAVGPAGDGAAHDAHTFMLSARSELKAAHSEVSYGPARALVWSLPAFGFLGTATEMADAVHGLSQVVERTSDYHGLQSVLTSDVIPPLADAFGVTLFALAAAVMCHLVLTMVHSREQRILLEADEAALVEMAQRPAPGRNAGDLNGSVYLLTHEINSLKTELERSNAGLSASSVGQLTPLLRSMEQHLVHMREELGRDMVISRGRVPGARP